MADVSNPPVQYIRIRAASSKGQTRQVPGVSIQLHDEGEEVLIVVPLTKWQNDRPSFETDVNCRRRTTTLAPPPL